MVMTKHITRLRQNGATVELQVSGGYRGETVSITTTLNWDEAQTLFSAGMDAAVKAERVARSLATPGSVKPWPGLETKGS